MNYRLLLKTTCVNIKQLLKCGNNRLPSYFGSQLGLINDPGASLGFRHTLSVGESEGNLMILPGCADHAYTMKGGIILSCERFLPFCEEVRSPSCD